MTTDRQITIRESSGPRSARTILDDLEALCAPMPIASEATRLANLLRGAIAAGAIEEIRRHMLDGSRVLAIAMERKVSA